ncbi:MAG TPA: BON domain-containing protein [Pirellulales bacterium]|jgi:osmotically-inducible protein OsmY|nr:BON domain-containing protein [Pirellulales bacterium]
MGDAQLVERVSSVLEQNPHVPHRNLRFEASEGQIVLRGIVRSYYQKQMAQEAVGGIDGVQTIENQLEVNWT